MTLCPPSFALCQAVAAHFVVLPCAQRDHTQIADMKSKTVREAVLGETAVFRGTLRAKKEGETLTSPVSQQPCLVYQFESGSTVVTEAVDLVFTDASGPRPILAKELASNNELLLLFARSYGGPKGFEASIYEGDQVSLVAMPVEVKSSDETPRSYRSGVQTQVALGAPPSATLNITRRGPGTQH